MVDPGARLGTDVKVGPFAVIENEVVIGARTEIMASAQILSGTTIGSDCTVCQGVVVGGLPQDLKFEDGDTPTFIGDGTILREYVTIHRGTQEKGTLVGSGVYLMAYVHVGHDSIVGDNVILANTVQLGGFVQIHEYAFIGGSTPVHQLCRVGTQAFVGGGYRVVQDVPPYIMASGEPLRFGGINAIGLRRRGFTPEVRNQIKRAYKLIYRSDYNLSQATAMIREQLDSTPEIQEILAFIEQAGRGLI